MLIGQRRERDVLYGARIRAPGHECRNADRRHQRRYARSHQPALHTSPRPRQRLRAGTRRSRQGLERKCDVARALEPLGRTLLKAMLDYSREAGRQAGSETVCKMGRILSKNRGHRFSGRAALKGPPAGQ